MKNLLPWKAKAAVELSGQAKLGQWPFLGDWMRPRGADLTGCVCHRHQECLSQAPAQLRPGSAGPQDLPFSPKPVLLKWGHHHPWRFREATQVLGISLFSCFMGEHWAFFVSSVIPTQCFSCPSVAVVPTGPPGWRKGAHWGAFLGQMVPGCIESPHPALGSSSGSRLSWALRARHEANTSWALQGSGRGAGAFCFPAGAQLSQCHLQHNLPGCFYLSALPGHQKAAGL